MRTKIVGLLGAACLVGAVGSAIAQEKEADYWLASSQGSSFSSSMHMGNGMVCTRLP